MKISDASYRNHTCGPIEQNWCENSEITSSSSFSAANNFLIPPGSSNRYLVPFLKGLCLKNRYLIDSILDSTLSSGIVITKSDDSPVLVLRAQTGGVNNARRCLATFCLRLYRVISPVLPLAAAAMLGAAFTEAHTAKNWQQCFLVLCCLETR